MSDVRKVAIGKNPDGTFYMRCYWEHGTSVGSRLYLDSSLDDALREAGSFLSSEPPMPMAAAALPHPSELDE